MKEKKKRGEKKEKEKNMVDYTPKRHRIWKEKRKKILKNNPLIPAAAMTSRSPLFPSLITEPFPFPEPGKLLRLSPL